jgi:hypothetical protein
MKEYMLFIRNAIDHQAGMSQEQHQQFLKACQVYIEDLQSKGKLIAAQPISKKGGYLSKNVGAWNVTDFPEANEVIVGYYHVRANDDEDAVLIAKGNPEFAFTKSARIEIRPIKTKEDSTGFLYPNQ